MAVTETPTTDNDGVEEAQVVEEAEVLVPDTPESIDDTEAIVEDDTPGTDLATVEEGIVEKAFREHPDATLIREANELARTDVFPAYRKQPEKMYAIGKVGQRYGWDLAQSLQQVYIVEGKTTLGAETMLRLIREHGHFVGNAECTREYVRITGRRGDMDADDPMATMTVEYHWEEAVEAGLSTKANWKKFRSDMMWARAVSRLARRLFSDVTQGAYVKEEVEASLTVVDTAGPEKMLDVQTGELVEINPAVTPEKTDPTMVNEALRKFGQVPTDKQAKLKGWMANFKLNGEPRGWKISVESLPDIPGDVVQQLIDLCDKAIDMENSDNRAPDSEVDPAQLPDKDELYAELKVIHDNLDDKARDLFETWCQEKRLNPFSKRLGVQTLVQQAIWLKAHAGIEPFDVAPAEEAPDAT